MTAEEWLELGRINANLQAYKRKKVQAIALASGELMSHKSPSVSVSGGKDSVAMACIVDEAARLTGRDFTLWAHISDASFPGTEETIYKLAAKLNRQLVISSSDDSAFDALKNPQKRAFGKSGVFFDSIREFNRDFGIDLTFTGVRAMESRRRMKAARAHGACFDSTVTGKQRICNPITWFNLNDVASALLEYDAPIHPIYFKQSVDCGKNALGEPQFIRLGYATSRDLLNKGTTVFIKYNYPAIYQKLLEAWPEAAQYT